MSDRSPLTPHLLDFVAVVLAGGSQEDYHQQLDALMSSPREALQALAHLLMLLSRADALADVRHMAVMVQLADVEAAQ